MIQLKDIFNFILAPKETPASLLVPDNTKMEKIQEEPPLEILERRCSRLSDVTRKRLEELEQLPHVDTDLKCKNF